MGAEELIIYSVILFLQINKSICITSKLTQEDRSMCFYGNDSSKGISTSSKDCLLNNDTIVSPDEHAQWINQQLTKFSQKENLDEFLGTCDHYSTCDQPDNCMCDSLCGSYGDCCMDAQNADRGQTTVPYSRYRSCVGGSVSKGEFGLVMISECPESSRNYTNCENVDIYDVSTFVPVIGDNGLIYRNRYCAGCHGVTVKDYMKLEISGCRFESGKVNEISPWLLWQIRENANECKVQYTSLDPHLDSRKCIPTRRVNCPPSHNESMTPLYNSVRQKCLSHLNPYTYAGTDFRSLYCFVCETGIPEGLQHIHCLSNVYHFFSMTWLFDIYPKEPKTPIESECRPDDVFMPFLEQCVQLQCPRYATKKDRACKKEVIRSNIQFLYKFICMKVSGKFDFSMTYNAFRLAKDLMVKVTGYKADLSMSETWKVCENETTFICDTVNINHIREFFEYEGTDSDSYYGQQIEVIYPSDTPSDKTTYKLVSSEEIDLLVCHEHHLPPMVLQGSFVCRKSHDTVETSSSSTSVVNDNVFHCFKDVLTMNNTVRGTKPTSDSGHFSMEKLKTYLTLACLTLSVLSLFVCILRKRDILLKTTLPKKLLFNVMLIQMISNALFFLVAGANDVREICFVAGVILHYCWLSSYFWTTVYTFHLYYTFVISIRFPIMVLNMNRSTNHKLFLTYSIIGYITPLAFIIPTVVLDIFYGNELDYYGDKICFLAIKEAVVFCFFIPVAMSYILNIFCFSFTTVFVKRMQFKIDSWKKSFKTNARILLKMSTIMGWTWIFGCMASLLQNDVLWIVFVCSHGLQGFFLAWINGFANIKSSNTAKQSRAGKSQFHTN